MKLPGPDYPITIKPASQRVRVKVGETIIADSTSAMMLKESSYPGVHYIPRSDTRMDLLTATDRVTHCPYKGDASYYSIAADGHSLANAVWSYETPFPAVQQIAGHLAFYPDKVTIVASDA